MNIEMDMGYIVICNCTTPIVEKNMENEMETSFTLRSIWV